MTPDERLQGIHEMAATLNLDSSVDRLLSSLNRYEN
jgi:hypothetical protein